MKLTTKILITLLLLFTTGLFASNFLIKKEYDKSDKTDIYFNYAKILEQPFRHIKIEGGNISNISFEQKKNPSVRVFRPWIDSGKDSVKARVEKDTLFLTLPDLTKYPDEKEWLKWVTLVRVFSPQLLSVDGVNTKFKMVRLKQKNLAVTMSGKSDFEVESNDSLFDRIQFTLKDSSRAAIRMSPGSKSAASFHADFLSADIQGISDLDISQGQMDSLKLSVSDKSGISLSGKTLKNYRIRLQIADGAGVSE